MTIAWPVDIIPSKASFSIQYNTTTFVSTITGSHPTLRRAGERWVCSMDVGPEYRENAQRIDGLLAKLKGAYNTILLGDMARPYPSGSMIDRSSIADTRFADVGPPTTTTFTDGTVFDGGAAGITVYGGWDAGSESIMIDGVPQYATGTLLAGDYIGVGGGICMLTEDSVADEMGRALLSIVPPLRAAVVHGASITFTNPTAEFRLVDDGQPRRQMRDFFYKYSLAFTEAL